MTPASSTPSPGEKARHDPTAQHTTTPQSPLQSDQTPGEPRSSWHSIVAPSDALLVGSLTVVIALARVAASDPSSSPGLTAERLLLAPLELVVGFRPSGLVGDLIAPLLLMLGFAACACLGGIARSVAGIVPILRRSLLIGTVSGIALFLAGALVNAGALAATSEPPAASLFRAARLAIEAAVFEEAVFRSIVCGGLLALLRATRVSDRFRPTVTSWAAVVVGALAFGAAHPGPDRAFAFGAGLVFGWVFLRYGLTTAVASHFLYDLLVFSDF